jgi:YD repeat-containing protein
LVDIFSKNINQKFNLENLIVDPLGRTGLKNEYNANGNIIAQIDSLGNITTYTYDDLGNQLTETITVTTENGPRQQTTTWTYNNRGQVLTKTAPLDNKIEQEYDLVGNLVATIEVSFHNRRTEYRYDDNNRLVETLYADGT